MNVKKTIKRIRLWSVALFWMFVLTTFLVIPMSIILCAGELILEIGKLLLTILVGTRNCWDAIKKGIDEGLETY